MKAYWKSQWLNICIGLVHLVFAIVNMCQGDEFISLCWMVSSAIWLIMSRVSHNEERIKALEREVEQLKNRAITDIEEKSTNHFIVRRKLGPDKEVK